MESKPEFWNVEKMVQYRDQKIIHVNSEYQRGEVWNNRQKLMLIDSVLRGYYIPLFYFRVIKRGDAEYGIKTLEIIDGQQRIEALYDFVEEKIPPLYDPSTEYHFPESFGVECPWAGKLYHTLPDNIRKYFDDRKFSVIIMDCDEEEARDMFIRLQAGSALNPQEVRDAWPGAVCQLILELGGKSELDLPGHEFLRDMVLVAREKRGQRRQVAVQLLASFIERRKNRGDGFIAGKNEIFDDFYRRHISLSKSSPIVQDFIGILDKMVLLFRGAEHRFKVQEAVHMLLFVDELSVDKSRGWETRIADAFSKFLNAVQEVRGVDTLDGGESDNFKQTWEYYQMTRGAGSNNIGTIKKRHAIFAQQMRRFFSES